MTYRIDHDFHIHTHLSICSGDPGQTPEAILDHAKSAGWNTICLTDHYWDRTVPCNTVVNWWYEKQNYDYIARSLPLPQETGIRFLFGCEADLDSDNRIGVPPSRWDDFGFMILSTTHFNHMTGPKWEDRSVDALAAHWADRLETVLEADLPFRKMGIAHLACRLINQTSRGAYLETLDRISSETMERLFVKAAERGIGIELNSNDMSFAESEADTVLRMFRIAKACGCRFYLGGDAHDRQKLKQNHEIFERAVRLLDLKESDKFRIP